MVHQYLLTAYLIAAGFVAGVIMSEQLYGKTKGPRSYLDFMLAVPLGILFYLPACILDSIIQFIRKAFTVLQIGFFIKYLFTKELDNISPDILRQKNNIARNHFNTGKLKDRIYRYCLQLLNKRNKYTHS